MISLESSYATDLDDAFWIAWEGAEVPDPRVILLNEALAAELGLDAQSLRSAEGAALLSGMRAPEGSHPVAQAYAGHQFGGFSPRLGDGRALLVGEIRDPRGRRWDLHLKGSGRTPFSRGGDGKAVLGPVLREYLMGEAMHALGIPTTRGLAALVTGEQIVRQDGPKPGAILARVASSHLRVGTFEYFSARRDDDRVRRLVEYALERHDPELLDTEDPALELFRAVRSRQAALVAEWMGVGFIHGVMNTDNTSISGETIDYGPCAFMDTYDPATVFSSIDRGGRYAYGRQASVMQWNLARLAEALLPLFEVEDSDAAVELAGEEVERFGPLFLEEWTAVMRGKLGLEGTESGDARLAADLLDLMAEGEVDFTRGFRALSDELRGDGAALRSLFDGGGEALDGWVARWEARLDEEGADREARAVSMDRTNPIYIPRNHLVEEALDAAESRLDLDPVRALLDVLSDPFTRRPGLERYAEPAPGDFGPYVTFCGT
ncbi:MAG TPA: YdiU family protein [Longimicrobiales bacterium]|nr:YdiU family protein [Longimicrobiales bacterium]